MIISRCLYIGTAMYTNASEELGDVTIYCKCMNMWLHYMIYIYRKYMSRRKVQRLFAPWWTSLMPWMFSFLLRPFSALWNLTLLDLIASTLIALGWWRNLPNPSRKLQTLNFRVGMRGLSYCPRPVLLTVRLYIPIALSIYINKLCVLVCQKQFHVSVWKMCGWK